MQDLASKIIDAILAGKPVYIMADFDGTISEHVDNPALAKVNLDCFAGLIRLEAVGIFTFLSTGRHLPVAKKLITPPYATVVDCNGNVLVLPNDKKVHLPIVASHGIEYLDRDGIMTRYDIGKPANDFMERLQREVELLQGRHPDLFIEKKYGAVSINTKLIENLEKRAGAYEAAKNLMKYFVSISPEREGNRIFNLAGEGETELEVRPAEIFGKHFGLRHFIRPEHDALIIQLGDSFGKEGTDRGAAEMLNDKTKYTNGHVLFVKTKRNSPQPSDSPARAEIEFKGPAHLGEFLNGIASQIEASLSSRPKMERSLRRRFHYPLLIR